MRPKMQAHFINTLQIVDFTVIIIIIIIIKASSTGSIGKNKTVHKLLSQPNKHLRNR